jgi:hypothetical protein
VAKAGVKARRLETFASPGGDDVRPVVLHYHPDLPGPERRDCVIEFGLTGEWLIGRYVEEASKWTIVYGAPMGSIPPRCVTRWAYLDEIFGPIKSDKSEQRGEDIGPADGRPNSKTKSGF